jgi:hypothetical protein
MKKKMESALRKALLKDGEMVYELYEWEMEEYLEYWRKGMHEDKDEFVFVLDERKGAVAMVLITKNDELFINEEARDKLKVLWEGAYISNIEKLMPLFVDQLSKDILPVNGLKYTNTKIDDFGEEKQSKK